MFKILKNLSKKDTVSLLEVVYNSSKCISELDLKRVGKSVHSLVGFEYGFGVYGSINDGPQKIINIQSCSSFLDYYFSNNLYLIDPLAGEHYKSFKLQFWKNAHLNYPVSKSVQSELEQFNLNRGITYGTCDYGKSSGTVFTLAGDDLEQDKRTETIVSYIIQFLSETLRKISLKNKILPNQIKLTSKEKEVLQWLKEGKTSWEIGVILQISERGVNFHISNIKKKLNCSNRTQAVAAALNRGLIQF